MKAIVKAIDLIDYENWAYWPDSTEDFGVAAEAMIGSAESGGADIFSFEICTPIWFKRNRLDDLAFARSTLFVAEYDEDQIKNHVIKLVLSIEGDSWVDIAAKLSRFMTWEYEDYQAA